VLLNQTNVGGVVWCGVVWVGLGWFGLYEVLYKRMRKERRTRVLDISRCICRQVYSALLGCTTRMGSSHHGFFYPCLGLRRMTRVTQRFESVLSYQKGRGGGGGGVCIPLHSARVLTAVSGRIGGYPGRCPRREGLAS